MQFRVHKAIKRGRTLVLSPKAQMVLAFWLGSDEYIRKFSELRDMYLDRRDAESINKITTFEIESLGVESALKVAGERRR